MKKHFSATQNCSLEEQKVILKIFRALSEEGEEGFITQRDSEMSSEWKKNVDQVCEKALKRDRSSPSHVLLPPGGEEITCGEEEAENEAKMKMKLSFEERNIPNDWAGCAESSSGSFEWMNVQNQWRNHEPRQQDACQHIRDCSHSGCVCTAALQQDGDGRGGKQGRGRESEHSDMGCGETDASGTSSARAESLITPTQSWPEAGEEHGSTGTTTLEQSAEHVCKEHANEECSGEGGEGKNKGIKVFPDHPSSPKDTSLNISITPSDMARNPPSGSTISRATYSPGSPTEKHTQLPALFSGLRVLRKGVLGPEHDSVAPLRPRSQSSDQETLPEKGLEVKGSILDQISNFLSREKRSDEKEEEENEEDGEGREEQTEEDAEAPAEPVKHVSSAEAAFDAFKAFFTPKPLKKDPGDKVYLEAVRKRIKAERDALRALFERTSVKSSEENEPSKPQVGTTCYETYTHFCNIQVFKLKTERKYKKKKMMATDEIINTNIKCEY